MFIKPLDVGVSISTSGCVKHSHLDRRTALLLIREFVSRLEERSHPSEVAGPHAEKINLLIQLLANAVHQEQDAIREAGLEDETDEDILGETVAALQRIVSTTDHDATLN